jgi:hypothetical protein
MKKRIVDPRDDIIENLKRELSNVRQDVIELSPAPESAKELLGLQGTYHQKTAEDYSTWKDRVIAAVVELAVPDPTLSNPYYGDRAACPLCKSVGLGAYRDGFKLPTGLEYHLEGKMNARQCRVTAAAFEDALAALHRRQKDTR